MEGEKRKCKRQKAKMSLNVSSHICVSDFLFLSVEGGKRKCRRWKKERLSNVSSQIMFPISDF